MKVCGGLTNLNGHFAYGQPTFVTDSCSSFIGYKLTSVLFPDILSYKILELVGIRTSRETAHRPSLTILSFDCGQAHEIQQLPAHKSQWKIPTNEEQSDSFTNAISREIL